MLLPPPPLEPASRAALGAGLDEPPSPRTVQLAAFLSRACGPAALALIHYGSHAQHSGAQPESAHDFFVIVERYAEAYRALASAVRTGYRPRTAALLNHVLPPNVIAVTVPGATPRLFAKCAVLSLADLRRACSARSRDHFVLGRLFQHVQLVWSRDPGSRQSVTDALVAARALTLSWGRPYLPSGFDVDTYCRTLLVTSYAGEIRPEGSERIDALLAAQRETMDLVYRGLLDGLVATRILGRDGKIYTDPDPPGQWAKFRVRMYFRRSKLRATLRWLKYVALYDDWLDYIVQKVARRSGVTVVLTERERRWPLIFLWPKVIRFLRTRPQRND